MKRQSDKTAALRIREKALKEALIEEIGHCEICGHNPSAPRKWKRGVCWALHKHEIARGQFRAAAADKRCAVLLVCFMCHQEKLSNRKEWPEARQLAALKLSRPSEYDLAAYRQLKYPNAPEAITEAEVEKWL